MSETEIAGEAARAGGPDAGGPDAGGPDAGVPDAGGPDAGGPDAGGPDAGGPDAGGPDAGGHGEPARDGGADAVRSARAYLACVAEPPAPALAEFIGECGPITAAARVAAGRVPEAVAAETSARRERAVTAGDLDRAQHAGIRLIIPEDDEWPRWPLLSLQLAAARGVAGMCAPVALWARGTVRLDEACERAATVVGARAPTSYGEYVAADWAYSLAAEGVTIASGAAYGIDAAAHRGALAAGGATVAVLGCGLDVGYPAGHDVLFGRIAECGVVLSEYPPGTSPARHRFLVRNRLLAALGEGTVVVEAGVRSGARNTATTAGILGKSVMAVPGPITSSSSAGCHDMIRAGVATVVSSAAEVTETAGRLGVDLVAREQRPKATDKLSRAASQVHNTLRPRAGKSAEQIATESGVDLAKARALLCELELDGWARRGEAGWCRSW